MPRLASFLTSILLITGCTEGALGDPPGGAGVGAAAGAGGQGAAPPGGSGGAAGSGAASPGGAGGAPGGAGGSTREVEVDPFPLWPCPEDMALIPETEMLPAYCIDRYEAPNEPGAAPLVMQSALTGDAWCGERGKRLCTEDEWQVACRGSLGSKYPYGDAHVAGACNDDKTWIAPNEGVLATWPSAAAQAEVDKLYQAEPSGSFAACASDHGVFDLTGNVEEWVIRTKPHMNNYDHILVGCYWSGCYGGSKPTCGSINSAHADAFMFYETGFRCCADALPF